MVSLGEIDGRGGGTGGAAYNIGQMKAYVVLLSAYSLAAAGPELTVGPQGQYQTVQAAVDAAAPPAVIHIPPGIYKERVVVPYAKPFLTFRGDDPGTTVITNNSHAGLPGPKGPINTFATQTVFIQANDFIAENLTFENSAATRASGTPPRAISKPSPILSCSSTTTTPCATPRSCNWEPATRCCITTTPGRCRTCAWHFPI